MIGNRFLLVFILALLSGVLGCSLPAEVAITDSNYEYSDRIGQLPVEVVDQINHKYPNGFWKNSGRYSPVTDDKKNAHSQL